MDWYPWNFANLRGDPTRSESVRWGKELFTQISTYRPLIALVDYDLLSKAKSNPKLAYLLQLISEEPIQAHLYGDAGPDSNAQLSYIREGRQKVEAYKDWVDVRPTDREDFRLFAWFRDGKPYHRKMWLQDNAFLRIATATPPAGYGHGTEADAAVRADAMAMLAADAISADIFVTERHLPHLLGHNPWARVTVLSPDMALPIVGLYLRGQGRFVFRRSTILGQRQVTPEQQGPTRYEFFWTAAEALVPEHDRWRIACRASAQATDDETLTSWQSAVVHRMRQTLQARDRLLRRSAVRQDWDTAEDVVNELDQMLVWIMGAFDVCARVAHLALGLPLADIHGAGWQKKDSWMRKVKRLDCTLGGLVTGDSTGRYVLEIVATLRNLIHSAPLGTDPQIFVIGQHALETWVRIPVADRKKILDAMTALGGSHAWGVRYPLLEFAGQYPKTKDDPHLHPGLFVERLLPYVIKLLNELMAAVPVHQLPGLAMSPSQLSWGIPPFHVDQRVQWQLAIGTV